MKPLITSLAMRPPGRSDASITVTSTPADSSVIAALRPARPAPMMRTSAERDAILTCFAT